MHRFGRKPTQKTMSTVCASLHPISTSTDSCSGTGIDATMCTPLTMTFTRRRTSSTTSLLSSLVPTSITLTIIMCVLVNYANYAVALTIPPLISQAPERTGETIWYAGSSYAATQAQIVNDAPNFPHRTAMTIGDLGAISCYRIAHTCAFFDKVLLLYMLCMRVELIFFVLFNRRIIRFGYCRTVLDLKEVFSPIVYQTIGVALLLS
jgi:hypothetical protein